VKENDSRHQQDRGEPLPAVFYFTVHVTEFMAVV